MVRHLIIAGRVQGVGFRYSLMKEAQKFGVTGWVRNRSDGSVEAVVAGEASAIEKILAWAHRGPTMARVDSVHVSEADGNFSDFSLHETA